MERNRIICKKRKKWLKKYLELPNGIPSHDTIQRVISILDSKVLYQNCLKYFIEIIDKYIPKEDNEIDIYSIDGKTIIFMFFYPYFFF